MPKRASRREEDYEEDSFIDETDYVSYQDEPALKKIKIEIEKNNPDILKLIEADILMEDKCELVQLYEVYNYSKGLEKLELAKQIKEKLEKAVHKKKNFALISKLSELDTSLKDFEIEEKILKLNTTLKNKQYIYENYKRFSKMSTQNDEYSKLSLWMNNALSLPYDNIIEISGGTIKILQNVKAALDSELYGMQRVKEEILIYIAARLQNPNMQKCSLALVGPPGSGKTTIIRLLSKIFSIPLEQISLGGITNADFLKGHQYAYIGSDIGEIIKCLRRLQCKNGILFWDEFEKISENKEICAALLHILDPSQNTEFRDNYLSGLTFDLSRLWNIYSMNSLPKDNALCDRLYYIVLDDVTEEDKFFIVKDYIIPKAIKNIFQTASDLKITFQDSVITNLIKDKDIRPLEFLVQNILNKINFLFLTEGKIKVSFRTDSKIKFPFVVTEKIFSSLTS